MECKQKVQATTSNRMNINVAQQYCWHCAVDEVYDLQRTKNTGLCKLSGKSFGEVMPNFIIGLTKDVSHEQLTRQPLNICYGQ
jgi:hypothetical protein